MTYSANLRQKGWLDEILVVYPPKDDHPFPQRSGIELATIKSQFRHPNQNTKPLLYRKYCSSQFAVQLRSLVTNWTRKPRKGAAVIAASMHGFGNCRKFKSPDRLTLILDRVKVTPTYTVRVGLPANPSVWLYSFTHYRNMWPFECREISTFREVWTVVIHILEGNSKIGLWQAVDQVPYYQRHPSVLSSTRKWRRR